jgi:hypothetical protein
MFRCVHVQPRFAQNSCECETAAARHNFALSPVSERAQADLCDFVSLPSLALTVYICTGTVCCCLASVQLHHLSHKIDETLSSHRTQTSIVSELKRHSNQQAAHIITSQHHLGRCITILLANTSAKLILLESNLNQIIPFQFTSTMCCRHGARRQPPIVALAGAIYGAYQSRKEKRAVASAQEIGVEGGKYAAVPQQSHSDTFDAHVVHEKDVAPPNYEDVIRNDDSSMRHGADSRDVDSESYDTRDDERAFLAAGEEGAGAGARGSQEGLNGVKMGFFERVHARKQEKRQEREERREAWREEKRAWRESRAERRAEWRASRRCGRHAC